MGVVALGQSVRCRSDGGVGSLEGVEGKTGVGGEDEDRRGSNSREGENETVRPGTDF